VGNVEDIRAFTTERYVENVDTKILKNIEKYIFINQRSGEEGANGIKRTKRKDKNMLMELRQKWVALTAG